MTLKILLLVGTGSFLGGIFRYLLSFPLLHKYPHGFPWGTLLVNVLGCFCIGILYGYAEKWHFPMEWRIFLATGVLGGFTTFSTFSNETVTLIQNSQYGYAAGYITASVLLGLIATVMAYLLMRLFQ